MELQQKLEEKTSQTQSLHTELAVAQERLAKHPQELNTAKNHYEDRLKLAAEEKNSGLEKSKMLQAEIIKLHQQLSEQSEKHQVTLIQERTLQEQSETRWVKLIDQARTESDDLRKQYESMISKQNKQMETLQNDIADLQNKYTSQQLAFDHAKDKPNPKRVSLTLLKYGSTLQRRPYSFIVLLAA